MTQQAAEKKNYKQTLNLPQTAFPMEAKLVQNEPARLKCWQEGRLYEKLLTTRAKSPKGKWILHDGPFGFALVPRRLLWIAGPVFPPAERVLVQPRRDVQQPAHVKKMLVAGRALRQFGARPLLNELPRGLSRVP